MKKYLFLFLFPLDLFAAQLEIWVDRPGVQFPYVGHTWIEVVDDNGNRVSYEHNFTMGKNTAQRKKHSTSHSWHIKETDAIIVEMEERYLFGEPYNMLTNNCVHLIKAALKIARIPHPDFYLSDGEVPTPSRVYRFIKHMNEGYTEFEIAAMYLDYPREYTPVGSKQSLYAMLEML